MRYNGHNNMKTINIEKNNEKIVLLLLMSIKNIINILQQEKRIENALKHSAFAKGETECACLPPKGGQGQVPGRTTLQLGCPAQNTTPREGDGKI